MTRLILFETTHHAMWAEDVAREAGIPAEVVPAPKESDAKCGLALEVMPDTLAALTAALDGEGVPYRVHEA